jgi:hypothetical protein
MKKDSFHPLRFEPALSLQVRLMRIQVRASLSSGVQATGEISPKERHALEVKGIACS